MDLPGKAPSLWAAAIHRMLAFRLVRFPRNYKKATHKGWLLMVEPRGIEPLSESNLERLSPGAVCYLHSLTLPGTNTLQSLVAS